MHAGFPDSVAIANVNISFQSKQQSDFLGLAYFKVLTILRIT